MNKWTFKVTLPNIMLIILGAAMNLAGRWAAGRLVLPIWLDSVGTFLVAVILGPIAGAISGALMNVVTGIFNPEQLWFALVSIAGGLAVGRFFPRDRKIESFPVVATALFAGVVMTIVSTPLNLMFNAGYTGNVWGDALVDLSSNYINGKAFCCLLGGLLVNMPDKAVCIGIAMLIIYISRRWKEKKSGDPDGAGSESSDAGSESSDTGETEDTKSGSPKGAAKIGTMILIAAVLTGLPVIGIQAQSAKTASNDNVSNATPDFAADYSSTEYGISDGLVSLEINAIEQTSDGYIWAGAYSGLYRFNGSRFEKINLDERISNVICLYEDDDNRLWIGTNDSGIACYDIAGGEVTFYTVSDGLPSDSIRSICQDSDGDIYVSTTEETARILTDGSVFVYDSVPGITCLYSLDRFDDGRVAGVTSDGRPVIFQGEKIMPFDPNEEGASYTSLACGPDGVILVGTSGDEIRLFNTNDRVEPEFIRSVRLTGINNINGIIYSASMNGYFICASTGLAFVGNDMKETSLSNEGFSSSVNDAIVDYQGNIWFASTRQGVMKLSYDPFSKVFKKAGIPDTAVNALLLDGDVLYVGTDTGVKLINISTDKLIRNRKLTESFDGVRIRHLMKDTKGNVWVSTYGPDGLVCLNPETNEITAYNSNADSDIHGSRFRFAMELADGTILAASTEGLTYLKEGKCIGNVGIREGLSVPQILSATELPEGYILAGSDGDGIYILEDMKVTGHIGADEGLMSQVVLKIITCGEGRLYVTSNGLYYGSPDQTIRKLNSFPYNNNYDVYVTEDGEAWISSSAGVYVVRTEDLIADEGYDYILLNHTRGFDTTLTANAWNTSGGDELYLCCSDGIRRINTRTFDDLDDNYNIVIAGITDDEEEVPFENGAYMLPSGPGRIKITPAILSYTLANPCIKIVLEGTQDVGIKMHQAEMADLTYTSLPYGEYKLEVQVINELDGSVKKSQSFTLHKEAELYERLYYKLYLVFVGTMLVAFLAWMIAKMSNMAVINRQYDQIREAKEDAEFANQAKSRFLANMSHEIRTPINAVLGMDEMILRESTEPNIRSYANDIYTAGNTLLSLINDILDSSKIESGKMEIVPEDYELATLIKDLVNMVSQRAHKKDLVFNLKVDESLPSVLHGDDVRIRQAVTNILTNAVKYTPEGSVTMRVALVSPEAVLPGYEKGAGEDGTAEMSEGNISGSKQDQAATALIRFEVEDTGIGIKEEDLPKLFEEYQRIEEGRNRHIEGTGLGMNITIQLLRLMNSSLEVKSVYGQGSTFWFDLPQEVVDASPIGDFEARLSAPDESYDHKGAFTAPEASVLVVDDNDMNRKVFKSLLKVTQINISEAPSGEKALQYAENVRYDMVFMDHMMPDMDGVETMEHMRKIKGYADVPIYVLTANAVTGAREQYLEMGFDGFISKPVVSDKLEQALREALPPEKIIPIEEGDTESYIQGESAAVMPSSPALDNLPVIDGLDWNYAYLHLPDMELLESSLKDFYEGIGIQADKLDRMYDEAEEALKDTTDYGQSMTQDVKTIPEELLSSYRIQVHAMKSSAATVGIVPLAGMAKILEFAARDADADTIRSMHGVFIREWRSYKDKLKGVFGIGENEVPDDEKEEADNEMILAMLDMLGSALEDFDVDACDDIISKIRSYSYDDVTEVLVASLAGAVTDLDTDMAEEIISRIKDSLG